MPTIEVTVTVLTPWVTGEAFLKDPPPPPPGIAWRTVEGGEGLIKAGLLYQLIAPPGAGKSYDGKAGALEVVADGGVAAYLDFEGHVNRFNARLHNTLVGNPERGLLTDETIIERLHYQRIWGPVDEFLLPARGRRSAPRDRRAGAGDGLQRPGGERRGDFSRFIDRIVDRYRQRFPGIAIIMIDHPGHEGVRARGTSNKKAQVDVEFALVPRAGHWAGIQLWKDRDGALGGRGPGSRDR